MVFHALVPADRVWDVCLPERLPEAILHVVPLSVNAWIEGGGRILQFGQTAARNSAAGGSLLMQGLAGGQTGGPPESGRLGFR